MTPPGRLRRGDPPRCRRRCRRRSHQSAAADPRSRVDPPATGRPGTEPPTDFRPQSAAADPRTPQTRRHSASARQQVSRARFARTRRTSRTRSSGSYSPLVVWSGPRQATGQKVARFDGRRLTGRTPSETTTAEIKRGGRVGPTAGREMTPPYSVRPTPAKTAISGRTMVEWRGPPRLFGRASRSDCSPRRGRRRALHPSDAMG